MKSSSCLSQIYQLNFSVLYTIKSTSDCLSHKFINTIFLYYIQQYAMKFNNCLSQIYQHNFFPYYIRQLYD